MDLVPIIDYYLIVPEEVSGQRHHQSFYGPDVFLGSRRCRCEPYKPEEEHSAQLSQRGISAESTRTCREKARKVK